MYYKRLDKKHGLILVWKLTDCEVHAREKRKNMWNISFWNKVLFEKLVSENPQDTQKTAGFDCNIPN